MAQHLELLSATLLSAVPGGAGGHAHASDEELLDVEWSRVSEAIGALHVTSKEQLSTLTTRAAELDAYVRSEATAVATASSDRREIEAAQNEMVALLPKIEQAEQHFRQVEALVRPRLLELETLQNRAGFLEAAVQVEKRSQAARQYAEEASPSALRAFEDLAAFVGTLPPEYGAIRREAERRMDVLSADLRRFAVEKLQSALEKIEWPEPLSSKQEMVNKEAELGDVATAFAYLLALQLSQQQSQDGSASTTSLWAMDCVLEPLLLRFRFHFERPDSPTNRLSKPEWYLSHMLEQTRAHTRFLAQTLTPELRRRRESLYCSDAQILLLRGFIQAASRKLSRDLETLIQYPPLLCHTLDEVLLFEQAIDDAVAYGSWASAARSAYPRCIDVFTAQTDVLFAWTSADIAYAHEMLSASLEGSFSSAGVFSIGSFHDNTEPAWQLEETGAASLQSGSQLQNRELIPPVALQFVALLDFLSQRFTLMETEEQRYLYVVQVHLPLLRQFTQICDARGRHQLKLLRATTNDLHRRANWRELFVVVNALQHVACALAVWEQSSVFLDLSRKAARSEATRTEVLRMHVAYSKQVLSSAAQAASAAVLASDEAAAVRQALAGPGAMIGPTAALSAAYSVGSKTMRSLFRRVESKDVPVGIEGAEGDADMPSVDVAALATLAVNSSDPSPDQSEKLEEDAAETLLFSHTVFERQIAELKALGLELLDGAKNTVVRAVECDVEAYRSSSFWTETDSEAVGQRLDALREVSSELASSYTLVSSVLTCARNVLLAECWPALWKPLAVALDDLLFQAFYDPSAGIDGDESRLSEAGERQFMTDMELLAAIFSTGSAKSLPQSFLRQTRDVCRLLQLPASKLREIAKALDSSVSSQPYDDARRRSESTGELEQLTSILEACSIYALTPSQVWTICTRRLDLEGRQG